MSYFPSPAEIYGDIDASFAGSREEAIADLLPELYDVLRNTVPYMHFLPARKDAKETVADDVIDVWNKLVQVATNPAGKKWVLKDAVKKVFKGSPKKRFSRAKTTTKAKAKARPRGRRAPARAPKASFRSNY